MECFSLVCVQPSLWSYKHQLQLLPCGHFNVGLNQCCVSPSTFENDEQRVAWGIALCPDKLRIRPVWQPRRRRIGISFQFWMLRPLEDLVFLQEVRKVFHSEQCVCTEVGSFCGESRGLLCLFCCSFLYQQLCSNLFILWLILSEE